MRKGTRETTSWVFFIFLPWNIFLGRTGASSIFVAPLLSSGDEEISVVASHPPPRVQFPGSRPPQLGLIHQDREPAVVEPPAVNVSASDPRWSLPPSAAAEPLGNGPAPIVAD